MARYGYAPFRAAYQELASTRRRNLTQGLGGLLGPGTHEVTLIEPLTLCDRDYNRYILRDDTELELGGKYRITLGRVVTGYHIGTDTTGQYHLVDNRDNCSVYDSDHYGDCLKYARMYKLPIQDLELIDISEVRGDE